MKQRVILMLALLCAVAQGAWAQNVAIVDSEKNLYTAFELGYTNIRLDADIQLGNYLNIEGKTVTIDLNGHKLSRNLSVHGSQGHVIWAHGGSNLTLTSSVAGGSIEGGMANNGGAIHIPFGNTVSAENVIFRNNSAADHAGAIWNNGTFTATNCTFKNNTASDVGGIYNAVGAGNKLYYPSTTMTIGSCRAYFQLLGDLTAGEPEPGKQSIRSFEMNFDEEEMGIRLMEDGRSRMDDAWYTIDGRRIIGMPAAKGVYIYNGRKMIIK